MSINPISPSASPLPPTEEDVLPEDVRNPNGLSSEELHKRLVETNNRYVWDQMMRSTQNVTQEMLRQAREQQKEDENNERS